jgi:hypothetical protein
MPFAIPKVVPPIAEFVGIFDRIFHIGILFVATKNARAIHKTKKAAPKHRLFQNPKTSD